MELTFMQLMRFSDTKSNLKQNSNLGSFKLKTSLDHDLTFRSLFMLIQYNIIYADNLVIRKTF